MICYKTKTFLLLFRAYCLNLHSLYGYIDVNFKSAQKFLIQTFFEWKLDFNWIIIIVLKKKIILLWHILKPKHLCFLIESRCFAWFLLNFVLFCNFQLVCQSHLLRTMLVFFKAENFLLWSSCRMKSFPYFENLFASANRTWLVRNCKNSLYRT